jgi:hypothetical protein
MSIRSLEQRLDRLEQAVGTGEEDTIVICVRYVPHGRLKGFKNDNGFYCARLSDESEEQCYSRACELVRQHQASAPGPHCGILLFADCDKPTQQDWEKQAPAVAAYRQDIRG